jgi:hypothetical protein
VSPVQDDGFVAEHWPSYDLKITMRIVIYETSDELRARVQVSGEDAQTPFIIHVISSHLFDTVFPTPVQLSRPK